MLFRSTPPQGERPRNRRRRNDQIDVSIHAPAGGATIRASPPSCRPASFDPRPRRGSDVFRRFEASNPTVVSIHAPAGGATSASCHPPRPLDMFRSTPPQGERRPTRSASAAMSAGFDPRPRRGSDGMATGISLPSVGFDPRPRRGSDRPSAMTSCASESFDPRPRRGSDTGHNETVASGDTFRSTPPQGERLVEVLHRRLSAVVSIHAPAGGATALIRPVEFVHPRFDPRPRRGSDIGLLKTPRLPLLFRSTPPQGERRSLRQARVPHLRSFDPRPRRGSDRP